MGIEAAPGLYGVMIFTGKPWYFVKLHSRHNVCKFDRSCLPPSAIA